MGKAIDEKSAELLDEIRQMLEQYRREVPGGRRAWPESVKRRVFELHSRGVTFSEISRRTKIPYYTVIFWAKQHRGTGPGFIPVRVVPALAAPTERGVATVTVAKRGIGRPKSELVTVTVTTRSGIQIQLAGVGVPSITDLVARLERRS